MSSSELKKLLRQSGNPEIAAHSRRFFKTGPGEYGEGDKFLGIRVPILRRYAEQYRQLSLSETTRLLKSSYHEERLCALLILVTKYQRGDELERERIFSLYLKNTRYINNWDLVDSSAHYIVGAHLFTGDKQILFDFANSRDLWQRRIAIMSTFYFIREQEYQVTLDLAETLLSDREDLIHKAVGWMLREIGNRDGKAERLFLKQHYGGMPRTMLRYAIEKFPQPEREKYLKGKI
jgi:3-methyladenine DNA glycosylase AlkD